MQTEHKYSLAHNIEREHGFEKLRVEGTLPEGLQGTLYRTGPGLVERFGQVCHVFDTDGAVTAVRFTPDGAYGASKLLRSDDFLREERAGGFLYGTVAPWYRILWNNLWRYTKSTGNTNILSWKKRVFGLMEYSKPLEFDPDTLDTRKVTDFSVIPRAFSAHPHRIHTEMTTYNFGLRDNMIDLFALPDDGDAQLLTSFRLPWQSMVHDFIVSEHFAVFFIAPAKLRIWRAFLGIGDLSKYFSWKPEMGTEVVVVPFAHPDRLVRFRTEAFMVWHFVNAYDEGGKIIVDAIRHADFSNLSSPGSKSTYVPSLYRWTIDPEGRSLSGASFWDHPCEFPGVHREKVGIKHRYIWLQTFVDDDGLGAGVACFDTETHTIDRYIAPRGHLDSEPIFVSDGTGEEKSGWILQLTDDPEVGKSYLAVLDTNHLSSGPIAKVWFEQRIPLTFHGTFVAHGEA